MAKTKNNSELHSFRRQTALSVAAGIFFSLVGYFETKFLFAFTHETEITYSFLDIFFPIIIAIVLSPAFYLLFSIKIKTKEDKKFNLKRWHIFVPLTIISVIIFLAYFPGHHPADAMTMYESYKTGQYTTHFSPFLSLIMGLFISLGQAIGSVNIGYGLMIFLQILLVDIALTESIYYCSKKLKRKIFTILFLIFFIFHPLCLAILIRGGQDTIFGGIFLLLCHEFLKFSEDENYFNSKKKYIYLFTLIFLLCITRNNGVYTLIPVLLSGFFVLKNKEIRKKFLIIITIPIISYFGYQNLFINNVVAKKDSFFLETLGVPIMQIARSMYYNPDDESIEKLKRYFKNEGCITWREEEWSWEKYNLTMGLTDPYKDCMDTDEIDKNPAEFFSLWAKIGTNNLDSYFEAPGILMLGLFHPYMDYENTENNTYSRFTAYQWHLYIDCHVFNAGKRHGVEKHSFFPELQKFIDNLVQTQDWSRIPVIHLLWRAPFTTYLCIITIFFALCRKKYTYLIPLNLILGLLITVFFGPTLLFRYIFPAVICTPIMVYILIRIIRH